MAQPDRLQSQATDNRSTQADEALVESNAQEFVKAEPEFVLQHGSLGLGADYYDRAYPIHLMTCEIEPFEGLCTNWT